MADTRTQVSLRLSKDLLDEIDQRVEGSLVHENRSQYIRTVVRKALADENADFSEAR